MNFVEQAIADVEFEKANTLEELINITGLDESQLTDEYLNDMVRSDSVTIEEHIEAIELSEMISLEENAEVKAEMEKRYNEICGSYATGFDMSLEDRQVSGARWFRNMLENTRTVLQRTYEAVRDTIQGNRTALIEYSKRYESAWKSLSVKMDKMRKTEEVFVVSMVGLQGFFTTYGDKSSNSDSKGGINYNLQRDFVHTDELKERVIGRANKALHDFHRIVMSNLHTKDFKKDVFDKVMKLPTMEEILKEIKLDEENIYMGRAKFYLKEKKYGSEETLAIPRVSFKYDTNWSDEDKKRVGGLFLKMYEQKHYDGVLNANSLVFEHKEMYEIISSGNVMIHSSLKMLKEAEQWFFSNLRVAAEAKVYSEEMRKLVGNIPEARSVVNYQANVVELLNNVANVMVSRDMYVIRGIRQLISRADGIGAIKPDTFDK